MDPLELAKILVESTENERIELLDANDSLDPAALAEALQTVCFEVWTSDPQKVTAIVRTLDLVGERSKNPEVFAYAEWTKGIEALIEGDLERCICRIDTSHASFCTLDKPHLAAKTQTSKLYVLALLGRYHEAVLCGQNALAVFLAHDDIYSAGKIEHNIGNLYWRRDMYRESEPYLTAAHEKFSTIDDQRQLAMVENCQAFVKTLQNDFHGAEDIYRRALDRAALSGLTVTEAEVEIGLSNLYLFEGKYDLALKFMERSRQKYENLDMPNQSANCELEIADIYLELNLLPEAIEFFQKVAPRFAKMGMQAELARCTLGEAKARLRAGEIEIGACLLDRSEELYRNEGNFVAAGSVNFSRAMMYFGTGEFKKSAEQVDEALKAARSGENIRQQLFSRWLRTEIDRSTGSTAEAESGFIATLISAKDLSPEVEYLCLVSLGKLTGSEDHLTAAVAIVEKLRSSLDSDEMRTSYFADRVAPYDELVKIDLAKKNFNNAFLWHERSRGRVLADKILRPETGRLDDEKLTAKREEIKWLHNRINRSPISTDYERKRVASLNREALVREKEYSEILRRLRAGSENIGISGFEFDVDGFREQLDDAVVVEFAAVGGRISAFVVSKDNFFVLPNYADEVEISAEISQFRFQMKSGRMAGHLSESAGATVFSRLRTHSRRLYDLLLRPLESHFTASRLVFVPCGILHYLPFNALHDGIGYLIENFDISYSPSAKMLDLCLQKPAAKHRSSLIAGVADGLTPNVLEEMAAIAEFFEGPKLLAGEELTASNLKLFSAGRDIVHLACHGRFRPDNPGFSSLVLFGEELSVNDVYDLPLDNSIIVLSACESGVNDVVRGEELIGLTRAFFAAGAATLVLSLWRVDDRVTLDLMKAFYGEIAAGRGTGNALRIAQRRLINQNLHPYFWSPFIVSGRW